MVTQDNAPGEAAGGEWSSSCGTDASSVQPGTARCEPGAEPAGDVEAAARLQDLERARRAAWARTERAAASAALDRLAGVPIRGRDTVRTRRVLEWHGFDHSEIVAYVCGQADPQIEALADRLLGIGAAPPAPMPVAVKHLLSHLPMERDALRVRARAALAQSGWDPAAIDRALDGAADTAGTVAAANALDRHGWPAGDVLAALPGLAVLAVPA